MESYELPSTTESVQSQWAINALPNCLINAHNEGGKLILAR